MAKPPKYEVEKRETCATESGFCWVIWFADQDIVFWTEDGAQKACEALNLAEGLKKMKRHAANLRAALEMFEEE